MAITVTCPSCQKMCAVQDEHAGLVVRCPNCNGTISVPKAAGAAVPSPAAAADPVANASANLQAGFDTFLTSVGLSSTQKILVLSGLGCLALLTLLLLIGSFTLGLRFNAVVFMFFFFTAGALAFSIVAFVMKNPFLFQISVYVAAGWSAICALWSLVNFLQVVSYGFFSAMLFFVMVFSLGAAVTLGMVAVKLIMKQTKKS
jgi:hypothetical protein